MDELPVVVAPRGGLCEGPAYGDGDAFGGESEHHGGGGQCRVDAGGEPGGVGVGRGPRQGRVDREDGFVGFEEEVPGDPYVAQGTAFDVQVHHDELAAGDLVLTVHSRASASARLSSSRIGSPRGNAAAMRFNPWVHRDEGRLADRPLDPRQAPQRGRTARVHGDFDGEGIRIGAHLLRLSPDGGAQVR